MALAVVAVMNYTVWVCVDGCWRELHLRRRYTLTAALLAWDREVAKGTRGVRVLSGQKRQVACFQPRAAA